MTTSGHSLPGSEYHEPLRKCVQQKIYDKIESILQELEKVCKNTERPVIRADEKKLPIDQDALKFWFVDVARLMFDDKSTTTKQLALQALESVVVHIVDTNYQDQPAWAELRGVVSKEYTSLLDAARSEKDPNWHRVWSVLVRIVNRDLCQGSSVINKFLSIVEAGFRSPELSIREQSFDCWRLLVDVFAKNKQIGIPKRVKLICIPLKSSKSKTEIIAMKKFDIWWFLLCELRSQLDTMADTIFEPFIYFCFGPTFKTPLCYYFDESYREYGAPGKMYQSIKQLSAIALIHLLGPAPNICNTLLRYPGKNSSNMPFVFPEKSMGISPCLFSAKAKLIIDSCIECTVLFSQMNHLDYLALNRCLWNNLTARIIKEETVPKNEMLQWIKEDVNALMKLCILRENDFALRDLLYDTLLIMAESELPNINIGFDSPEQLMFNYKMFMSIILHPQLPCPPIKSQQIISQLFDLGRYTKQNAYWDMLQKTMQYMYHKDEDISNNSHKFRSIRTQIYCNLGCFLISQIRDDPVGFTEHQTTVMSFLLYPLEHDQLVIIDNIKQLWLQIYEPIVVLDKKSCEFTNALCEMIKAMTIAKHAYNLAVVAEYVCYIILIISNDFELTSPPVKVLELFKDLTRKGLAYQLHLDRIEDMVRSFRVMLKKLRPRKILVLITPISNVINELVTNEHGLAMGEVREMLAVFTNKIVSPELVKELNQLPNEVKLKYKALLKTLLDLPESMKGSWKVAEMKKCMNMSEVTNERGKKVTNKTPTRKSADEEFVVIDSVWKFKPETLTEHQREKMLEKRSDIPALYNDMSQSQDSFVIKPWTPSKGIAASKEELVLANNSALASQNTTTQRGVDTTSANDKAPDSIASETDLEKSMGQVTDELSSNIYRPDKENNNGNVVNKQANKDKEGQADSLSEDSNKNKNRKYLNLLHQLRIDTVEGKNLDVMSLPRTRRSEAEVPTERTTRRKSVPTRKIKDEPSSSVSKINSKALVRKPRHRSRKVLEFEDIDQMSGTQPAAANRQTIANESDDVIESSQSPEVSQSMIDRKTSLRRAKTAESNVETATTVALEVSSAQAESKAMEEEVHEEVKCASPIPSEVSNDKMEVDESISGLVCEAKEDCGRNSPDSNVNPTDDNNSPTNSPKQTEITDKGTPSKSAKNPGITNVGTPTRSSGSPSKFVEKIEIQIKGTPSKRQNSSSADVMEIQITGTPSRNMNLTSSSAVRSALNFATTSDGDGTEGTDENRPEFSSPKIARFSPLVVLEPIKDFAMLDVEEDEVKPVSHPIADQMVSKDNDEAPSTCPPMSDDPQSASSGNSTDDDDEGKSSKHSAPVVDKPTANEPPAQGDVYLSPMKNLDEEMEPLNKSLNHSIISSPDLDNLEERNADLLNSTLNISPISEQRAATSKNVDTPELPESADRRTSRTVGKERDTAANTPVQASIMSRRSRASPTPQTSSGTGAALKNRSVHQSSTAPSIPRSPSASMIGLGGRGAHLINLIRNQQGDQMPKPNTPPQNSSTPKGGQSSAAANRLMMRKKAIAGSAASATAEGVEVGKDGDDIRPDNHSQYLVFSKVLPSPQASPANSILKRRHNLDDSGDDIESPTLKRKRVSFHDPPVSLTKEYIRQVEECRPLPVSRSLQLSSNIISSADKAKYMMRRKSKSDSISELQSFTNRQEETDEAPKTKDAQNVAGNMEEDEEEITSSPESLADNEFLMNDGTENMTALQVTADENNESSCGDKLSVSASKSKEGVVAEEVVSGKRVPQPVEQEEGPCESLRGLSFTSEDALLEHVMKQYTLDDMLQRYIAAGQSLDKAKSVRILTKELSERMTNDAKIRDMVLDELSERHSKEFLDHAIQENSNAMVCERLSAPAMIDHLFKQIRGGLETPGLEEGAKGGKDEKDNETTRMLASIYEQLLRLPHLKNTEQPVADLREQFLRRELAHKNRLEVMALLEEYFITSSAI